MNKSYISIWSDALGTWVAAPEFASARGKRSKSRTQCSVAAALTLVGALAGVGFSSSAFAYVAGTGASAVNSNSTVVGDNASATTAACSTISGTDPSGNPSSLSTTATCATVVGRSATSNSAATVVVGDHASTTGSFSVAVGPLATAAAYSQAIGAGATASGDHATAIGQSAYATVSDASAIGTTASATGARSVAIGSGAHAVNSDAFALGWNSNASGQGSFALGTSAKTPGNYAVVMGYQAQETGDKAIALGYLANANGASSMAIGDSAATTAASATALGQLATGSGQYSTAVGKSATAAGTSSTAFGDTAVAAGSGAAALGVKATATGASSVALGQGATSVPTGSVAVGNNAQTINGNSIAIGRSASADSLNPTGGWSAIAIGTNSIATGDGATALGDSAKATVDKSTALGRGALASALNSTSIGAAANATAANSVALGAGSTTTANLAAAGYNPGIATLQGTASAANGEVSVGSAGKERRVTNVAAGSAATDAVNVSQLQSEAVKSANIGASTAAALGGGATYNADGTISTPSYTVNGVPVHSVGAAVSDLDGRVTTNAGNITTLQGQMADAVSYDSPAHDSLTLGGATSAPVALHNVADGVAGTDAINVNQLNTATTQLGDQITNVSSSLTNATRYFKANGNNDGTDDAVATGANAVAVGRNAVAGPASATAIGAGANALGQSSLAIGAGATATSDVSGGSGGIAIGTLATAGNNPATGGTVGPSIAIGGSSQADKYSVALGNGARALQDNGLALGSMARVTAAGAVALGYASTADRANTVSVGSVGKERQIVNVAAGAANTDAVNVSQLKGTAQSVAGALGGEATVNADGTISAPSYTVGGTTVGNVGDALSNLDGRVTTNAGNIESLQGQMADAVSYDSPAHDSVTLGGANAAPVALHNVAAGDLSAASTDAVNGSQLNATNQNVTDLASNLSSGTIGLVQQDATTRDITVGKDTDGTVVNMSGKDSSGNALNRTVTGVAAGAVNASSVDAINGGQLYATASSAAQALGGGSTVNADGTLSAPSYSVGGTTVHNVGDAVSNIDGRVTQNTTDITTVQNQINGGTIGLVQQDATTRDITVGKDTDGTVVNMSGKDSSGNALNRTVTGVAAGAVNASSVDAINGSQLYATASSAAQALGGGSTVNADGTLSAPSYSVGGTTVHNVGDAVSNIDGRVTQNTTDITTVQNQINGGTIGLVQQDATTRDITVGKDTDGTVVNMSGKDSSGNALNRTVTGVAAGAVNASSVDAINGSQLYATASSAAQALGGGSTVNADGTLSAPSYSVGGTTVHNVGDAVSNIDGRVTQNTTDITTMQNQLGDVGTKLSGAVQYDRNADGSVNFGAVTLGGSQSAAPVILSNVANGTSQYDAVNFGQLSALQNQVTDLNGQVSNLTGQVSNVQPGSPYFNATDVGSADDSNGAVVHAAAPGAGVGSTAAGAGAVASGNYATVIGANANAAADNAVAVGANAAATGVNSTAIGSGSQAANTNSVALGQGSATDRDNSVSVGSSTQQRQITNVAAGTADTDAVNVGQMNSSVAQGVQQANNYTDQRFGAMNNAINDVAKNAYAGIAAAMAMPNMTPSGPGKTIVAAGGATYKGGSAAAVGATYRSRNNKWLVNGAVSVTSTGDAGVRAQVGYEF